MSSFKILLVLSALLIASFSKSSTTYESNPLFTETEPLELVLEMDMHKVLNDKSEDPEYNPALLIQNLPDNKIQFFNIKIKARGRTRRIKDVCEFPPLKLNFEKDATKNTVFDGQDKVKMVTHCQNNFDYENYAVLEYLAYKTYNALTDYSYRVRLVRVVYRDIMQNYPDIEKSGFLIEDDDLMAQRLGGSISDKRIWSPDSCYQQAVDLFSVFQFMIGNTDWWIHKRHNVDIVALQNGDLIPVPFDFDYAGIINTPYAVPSSMLPIAQVSDRFFKGSCKTTASFGEVISLINAKKSDILKIIEESELLNKKSKKSATKYLETSYKIINDTDKFTKYINQTCEQLYHIPGMATSK
jgi:hypothetical protein